MLFFAPWRLYVNRSHAKAQKRKKESGWNDSEGLLGIPDALRG